MRQLTKKQKKFLDNLPAEITSVDDMTLEQYAKIQAMNDTEILYQNVNCYLWDRLFSQKQEVKNG